MKSFTICLITANRPELLKRALTSIIQLNRQDFSVIIFDNSKNDASERVAKKLLPTARYSRNVPPLNEIQNSNRCLSAAKTEIVCLLHDDDEFLPTYFDEIIPAMLVNKEIDLAYTGRKMVDQNDVLIVDQIIKDGKKIYTYKAGALLNFMLLHKKVPTYTVPINTPGLVFRKSLFDKVGKFDERIDTHCDTDFLLKVLSLSKKVLYINEPLYVGKIWYGLSGRTKTSERGEVFFAEKEVIDNFLLFAKKNHLTEIVSQRADIYRKFSRDAICFNGPLIWITLRYKGSLQQRLKAILTTAKSIIMLNRHILYMPKFYIVFVISFFSPQWLMKIAQKLLLKFYLAG